MFTDIHSITNNEDSPLKVFIEPCAFDVDILPGETYSFISKSAVNGRFCAEKTEDGITLWGWEGVDILIKKGEELILQSEVAFPIIGVAAKRWWQFWR